MRSSHDTTGVSARTVPRRGVRALAALFVVAATLVAAGSEARAERVKMPRIGQQFFTLGLNLQPGLVYDPNPPDDRPWNSVAPTHAGMARVGFHQIVSESFLMSADADLGLQWLNEHTADTKGRADSELAFAWQIALLGRWVPGPRQGGWTVGGGPHLYTAYLSDRPLQSLGFDLKAGRYIWKSDGEFVLFELGYGIPFIQGLNRDNAVSDGEDVDVPKNWTFHRFSISLQYGF